jgi:dihydropyrimidinase
MTAGQVTDLAVLGGQVVTPNGTRRVGVAMHAGRIVAVGPEPELPPARERVDVSGALVLPGAIDAHLHYDREGRLTDRVGDATRSGACGGVTSAVAFLLWQPGRRLTDTLGEAITELEAESFLDVGFHVYLHANDFEALIDIPTLVERGVSSFKMAMAYKRRGMMCSDEFLLAAMATIGRAGGLALVHAECGEAIDYLEQTAIAAGRRRPEDYPATRPSYTEAESIGRAATLGTAAGCPVYVVHLSSRLGLQRLLEARAAGQDIVAETCPQYLVLTEAEMARQGPLAKIAPPLRTGDDQEALWAALVDGELSIVASDHAPYPSGAKQVGWQDIFESPFGAPSIETMLPLLHDEGVVRRGLEPEWLAWVSSEGPARMHGLYPRKGTIRVGADADLVVLDPKRTVTVDPAALHSNADYTPYKGRTVQGWPALTIVAGEILVRDGGVVRGPGRARFLARPRVSGRITEQLRRPPNHV